MLFLFLSSFLSIALARSAGSLVDCLNSGKVTVLLPNTVGYENAIHPWNERITPPKPVAVAVPETVKEVSRAVFCANSRGIRVSAKSGGHSYGAFGIIELLVIDLTKLQTILFDPSTNVVRVGGGVKLGNLAKTLYSHQRAIPHGTCFAVGIGGHATLGGFGLASRMWGLTLDTVKSVEVVLANGDVVQANSTYNLDLFRGLRGAGPSFGIVTEFRMHTFPAPPDNINWSYTYNFLEPEKSALAMDILQQWGEQYAPKELGIGVLLFNGGGFMVRGVYYGKQPKFEQIIAPLLGNLTAVNNTPPQSVKTPGDWMNSINLLAGTPTPNSRFYAKSFVTAEKTKISLPALTRLFKILSKPAPQNLFALVIVNLYGGPGSAIRSPPFPDLGTQTSVYAHRKSGWVWQLTAEGSSPELVQYVKGFVSTMGKEVEDLPAYAPYVDPELPKDLAVSKYWGSAVAELKKLKTKFDPKWTLGGPQGI